MILETQRLYLREMTPADLPALCEILQDAEVMYAYEHAFDDSEVQQWLDKQLERYRDYGYGLWAVVLGETGRMIGQCGITPQQCMGAVVPEVGYLFARAHWHHGYAIEAAAACKQYAFDTLRVPEVFSIIRDSNAASQRVAQKNGMTCKAQLIKHYHGVVMPHMVYSVRRDGTPLSIAPLFAGWEETLIWACLDGSMGVWAADDPLHPTAAKIEIADFCFFAGKPNEALVQQAEAPILVPQNEQWAAMIAQVWQDKVTPGLRYAIKKEPDCFDRGKLRAFADAQPAGYTLQLIDGPLYAQAMSKPWSRDFCGQFADAADFCSRGLGVVVLQDGELVAGASAYTIYHGGLEIEIDTHVNHRRQGLATACGARLILECLDRGLYPSWDAYDLRSVALAQKLGYHPDAPYPIYTKV